MISVSDKFFDFLITLLNSHSLLYIHLPLSSSSLRGRNMIIWSETTKLLKSNNIIGTRTRDLSASIIVPQPTTLPPAPYSIIIIIIIIMHICICYNLIFNKKHYKLPSYNEEKVRQLSRPVPIYWATSKYEHEFWTTLAVLVGTLKHSVFLNDQFYQPLFSPSLLWSIFVSSLCTLLLVSCRCRASTGHVRLQIPTRTHEGNCNSTWSGSCGP
jgi:hypothetical protein